MQNRNPPKPFLTTSGAFLGQEGGIFINFEKLTANYFISIAMKLKTYETPEVELLRFTLETNFCESGGLDDLEVIDPSGIVFDAPSFDIF